MERTFLDPEFGSETPEAAQAHREKLQADAEARAAQAAKDQADRERAEATARAAAWEGQLKARYLSTPGATEAEWNRDRDSVISEARKRAALSSDDEARQAFASTYR